MSNQMLNATDPSCGCSKSTPSSPCNGGCGGPKPTACSPCVPSCHEQVNTYAELTANKSLFAGKYVSVMEEGGAVYHVSNDGNMSKSNHDLIEKIKNDKLITDKVTSLIDQRKGEISQIIQNGDMAQVKERLDSVGAQITAVKKEFTEYVEQYRRNEITAKDLESKLSSTSNKLDELDYQYKVLESAVSALDGTIDEKIAQQLGDAQELRDQIKRELLEELERQQ